MGLNVLKCFPYTKRHYLTHPHKFIEACWYNLRAAWQRITRGYADRDVWGMESWMLEVLPPMLRQLANGYGHPASYTAEEWEDKLNSIADVIESAQEEVMDTKNEYADAYYEMLNKCTGVGKEEEPGDADIRKLYYLRAEELYNERMDLIEDAGRELFNRNVFPSLWD